MTNKNSFMIIYIYDIPLKMMYLTTKKQIVSFIYLYLYKIQ